MIASVSTNPRDFVESPSPSCSLQRCTRIAASSADQETVQKSSVRILHLVDTLNIGGTESQLVQVAIRMQRLGHDVTVGCLRAEGPLLSVLQEAGVPVVEFRKERTLLSLSGARQMVRLAAFLRKNRFSVVHAHDLWSNLLGVPAARLARIPVIISSRRYLADLEWYTPWRNRIARFIYRLSTRVVVNSRAVRTKLVDRDGVNPEKIRIVYNAVDVRRFAATRKDMQRVLPNISESAHVIAVLANMYSRVKGHACLVSAARIVCKKEPNAVFLLIGDGPERPGVEAQVRDAGMERNIVFMGRRSDIPELLACCDLSVLASEAEALPNALLESMSAGLPVVATAVGGINEVIDNGTNGVLVAPGNPEQLAAAILRVLQDSRWAKELARAALGDVHARFSFDRILGELNHLYERPVRP